MAQRVHRYVAGVHWTGNYRSYERSFTVGIEGKPVIFGSSDPLFLGDASRYNPEDLLVASVSSCHMLWYLHLCAEAGVVVLAYADRAEGAMTESADGGRFTRVVLRPEVTISAASDPERARALHHEAHAKCFVANSVNFPIELEPTIVTAP
jgi:organic hydroperoxide reductase OsmC/OhrA